MLKYVFRSHLSIKRVKVCTEEIIVAIITVYFFIPHIL